MNSWDKKTTIILPTFNESENLRILLKTIFDVVPRAQVVIVDDSNSRENSKIKKIAIAYKNTNTITRQKKGGRGSAVLAGFGYALRDKSREYFVEMDTDLAHDPKELPLLKKTLEIEKSQLVIGSRYLSKSKIVNWPLWRLTLSKLINLFLNIWLGIGLHDYTDGYRMYRRSAVEYLVKTGLNEKNFIALSESAFLLKKKGYKIVETPITFSDRKHGESTVGLKELFISLIGAFKIKLRHNLSSNKKNEWFPFSKKQSVLIILLLTIFLRLWNLNAMGRTWDEPAYVEEGYFIVKHIKDGAFNSSDLYKSDHPPMARYLYGLAEQLEARYDRSNNKVLFPYDYTYPRLVSVILTSLSVVLVLLLTWEYFSPFAGFISALILAMLPFFLGFSQIATLESLNMFFFTASVFCFLKVLQQYSKKWIALTGILMGCAFLAKQSNILIIPLLVILYFFWYYYKKINLPFLNKYFLSLIYVIATSIITVITLWPTIIFHINDVLGVQNTMWFKNAALPPPEVFFGRLMLVPKPYYVVMFLITTPVIILIFLFLGLLRIDRLKKWILYTIVIWFFFPFIQSLYNFKQHGVQYIIQIYAPMSIIAGIGFEFFVYSLTTRKWIKLALILILFIYMFFILYKATPYYLDYFNGFTGGTNGVYKKRVFQLGWWGQGLKEAGIYLENNIKQRSSIGLAVSPIHSFPPLKKHNVYDYNSKKEYDYVVVSYFHVLRERFDDSDIKLKYKPIYEVHADNAPIVTIYKNSHNVR